MNFEESQALIYNRITEVNNKRLIISIIGSNGTRKSTLLNKLQERLGQNFNPNVYFHPDRRIEYTGRMLGIAGEAWPDNINDRIEMMNAHLSNQHARKQILSSLNFNNHWMHIIQEVAEYDSEVTDRHKQALHRWYSDGQQGPAPDPEELTSAKIANLIKDVLGYNARIEYHKNLQAGRSFGKLIFSNNGIDFEPSALSDGEKQILLLIPLLLAKKDSRNIVIVDEPELHLNELRAISLWDRLELYFWQAHFVYATHNIALGTRASVDATYLIGPDGKVESLKSNDTLPCEAVQNIVGARIQILKSDKAAIFCEDEMHELLFKELFRSDPVYVIKLSNAKAVADAVGSQSAWENFRSSANKYCGIIDRDMRTDDDVVAMRSSQIYCFPYNEAESLFLDRTFCKWMMEAYKKSDFEFIDKIYLEYLVICAKTIRDRSLNLIAKHVVDRNQCKLKIDYENPAVICEVIHPEGIELQFQKRAKSLIDVLDQKNEIDILKLYKGKGLYKTFVGLVKQKHNITISSEPEDKFRELQRTVGFEKTLQSLVWLQEFRNQILINIS